MAVGFIGYAVAAVVKSSEQVFKEVEDVRVYRYRHYSFSSYCKRD